MKAGYQAGAALLLATVCCVAFARAQGRTAVPGQPISTAMAGGDEHDYQVAGTAGRTLHVVIEQQGIDVIVSLIDPDGDVILDMDSPNGNSGPESIWLIPTKSGRYGIRVKTFDPNGAGRYELSVEPPRIPTRDDKLYAEAQAAMAVANRQIGGGGAQSRRAAINGLQRASVAARKAGKADVALSLNFQLLALDAKAALDGLGLRVGLAEGIVTYSSAGAEARTATLRQKLIPAIRFFESRLDVRPPVYLAVLDLRDWKFITTVPYGVPWSNMSTAAVVGMPAAHDFFGLVPAMRKRGLPSETLAKRLSASGLSLEQAMRASADEVMFHELGHNYAAAYGISAPNNWFGELLATYFADVYRIETRSNSLAPILDDVGREMFAKVTPEHTSLDDFERLYLSVGVENYVWYQRRFEERAEEVYKTQGFAFVARIRDLFPKDTPRMRVDDVLARLETVSPGWKDWAERLARMKASNGEGKF